MKKKILAALLATAMVVSLVACSTKETSTEEKKESSSGKKQIAVVLKTLSSEYWNYVKAGCDAAAEEFDVEVTVIGPNAESEIAQQVTMIEEQLGQNVDAIVCAPNDSSSAAAALKPAIGKIPVLFVDTDADLEGKTAFVGTGNEEAASLGGKYVVEKLGKGAKAVVIYGQEGEATSNARATGYKNGLKDGGGELLAEQSGNNTTDGALATMEDLLTRFPGEIQAVLCHNDDTALGALQACQQAGVKDIMIIGFDGNKTAVDSILAGDIEGTVAQQPYMMGYTAVEKALAAINGEKVDEVVTVDAKLITKENAQEYLDGLDEMLK
ncbi:sugar ABC transporter substrate-binding protein [Lachnospiraceae bacterium LCP25S3_G4]